MSIVPSYFNLINAVLGAYLWPFTLNAWFRFLGMDWHCVWWQGVILGLLPLAGDLTIPLAGTTWLCMFFGPVAVP